MFVRILNIVGLVVLFAWFAPSACLERIEPGKIGVRRSLEGGVAEEDFNAGYHVSLPFWHSWYQLDGTYHYLDFNADTGSALDVRTKENNVIYIDVIIAYRIKPGSGFSIVREGFIDTYVDRAKSTSIGILRKELAELSNLDVQVPAKRQEVALRATPILNSALERYHLEATHVILRGIRFREQYEEKLQNKQYFSVQGRLAEAVQRELKAQQETETLEKGIEKDLKLKEEEWNRRIEELRSRFEIEIATVEAEATRYSRQRRADADAFFADAEATGNLAEAQAEALGERLKAEALATRAGLTYAAIEAAKRFKMGDFLLNSRDPGFLQEAASMSAWRRFFLGE